ncbi:hypothetical protein NP493_63g06002 [Ridgeia piscesae]|uniref:Uncharacterized protein n=1 Tax=Ridgeia piscesae TaxID=27915 RepID=A0AAD9UIZ9_RIDPI|nr:hypothetical protein NP493_63g06002 [Ridgeia piscesae]
MSSYFVNSLALCYSDEVADSGGGQPRHQTQQPTQREYRGHGSSPYRTYPTGHHSSYPYTSGGGNSSSDAGAKRHDDLYVNERPTPQRATSRASTASPPAESTMASAAATTATDYSPTATAYMAGHMRPSPGETLSARRTASPPPPTQPSTPPPKPASQSRVSTPSPVPASQESPQQPTSTPMPTQIFPWMRRMHLGHGNLCCFAIARCQLC